MWSYRRLALLIVLLALVSVASAWVWYGYSMERRILALHEQGRWVESLELARQYLRMFPERSSVRALAGKSAARLDMLHEADEHFRKAAGLLPEEQRLHARILLKLKQWSRARLAFSMVADADPSDVECRVRLCALHQQLGSYREAIPPALEAVRLSEGTNLYPQCLYLLGNAYLAVDETSQAVDRYLEALEWAPRLGRLSVPEPTLRFETIDRLLDLARLDEAEQQLRLVDHPDANPEYHRLAGRLEAARGDLAGARARWERGLRLAPSNAGLLSLLASSHLDAGESAQAIGLLERAVGIAPKSSRTHFLLARAYDGVGDPGKAEASLARFRALRSAETQKTEDDLSIRANPNAVRSQWLLAQRALERGDTELARYHLTRVVQVDPNYESAARLLGRLEALR